MLIRNQFLKLFTSSALPVLEKVIFEEYNRAADCVKPCFNVLPMDRDITQSLQISGLPSAPENSEGASVEYEDIVQGYAKTYTALKYRLGVKITREMIEDGRIIDMKKLAQELGHSMYTTRQVQAAAIFNNATTTAGPDGVALGSASHPLFASGGTDSNTATADLAVAALRAGLVAMRETLNPQGLRVPHMAKKLVVTTSDQFLAAELLQSVLKPGGSTNDVNTFPSMDIVVVDYLTDADTWFLLADKHDLNFFERTPMELDDDVDFDGDSFKIACRERFAVGFSDWRGVFVGVGN